MMNTLTNMNLQETIRRILKEETNQNTRRTDIGRDIDTFLFDDLYDNILGSAYFKFQDYDIWFDSNGEEITDDATNQILNTMPIQKSFRTFEEWKDSEWYYNTEFPFSNKDWSMVKSGDKESFKWHSTGHKQMEEKIFNSYLKKYGRFMVVNLTDK